MARNKVVGGSLGTKIVNSAMAVVLVLGLSPITKASATSQSSVSAGQGIEQQVADSAGGDGGAATGTGSEGSGVETVSTAQGSGTGVSGTDTGEGTKAAVGDGSGSTGSDTGTDTGSAKGDSAGNAFNGTSTDSNDPAPQSSDEGIALASVGGDTTGSYKPDADFVDISNNCNASVELFSDSNCSTPLGNTAKSGDESFYGKLTVTFNDGFRPTLSNPNLSYVFPANAKVSDLAETTLYDNGVAAGTWYISNGVAYFKYSESYLSQTVVNANIKFEAKLNGVDKGDGNSEQLNFPGTSSAVTVNTKDGSVYGSKFGGNMNEQWNGPTYNQDDGTYTWTVKVTPTAHATNVVLTDTIGSNLTFEEGSFKLVDASGNPVSGTCTAKVSDQTATISLGDLSAGDYYVQYKTKVNSLPTTDNTEISDANNSVKWSWGVDRKGDATEASSSPQSTKYSMASKYADGSSTPDRIKWVVTLNSGSIKADMGGYTFTDTIGTDQTFLSDGVTITDQSGAAITPTVSETDSSLSFTFPSDAGKQQYTVTYYTKMSDTSSKDAVSNTATVTPPNTSTEPKGTATGTYNPPDTGKYITKTLNDAVSSDGYDGKASWKSEILFSDMSTSTDPTSIVFKDVFSGLPNGVQVSLDGDVTLTTGSGTALVENTDYTISKATDAQGTWGQLFKVTFIGSDTVKNLIGADGAKVVVSYGTKTTQVSGEYPNGTYKNKSSVATDKKSEIAAEADYTIEKAVEPPAVLKNGTSSSWDADYDWGDGTKGAWITDWKVAVNRTGEWEYQYKPVLDLKGADVVVADVLPTEGYSIIKGDVTYKLREGAYGDPVASGTVTPSYTQSDAVITVPTKKADGTSYGKVYVELSYQTATKGTVAGASGTDGAVNKEVSNTAQATSGSYSFPQGSGTVQLSNKALSKTSGAISGSSARQYNIVVNENGYDLAADSDTITLVDDMDSRGTFAASTLSVMAGDGMNLLTDGRASYTLSNVPGSDGTVHTRLSLTIPDNTKVTVKYEVMPSGNEGDLLTDFTNTCSLTGLAGSEVADQQSFNIASNSGGTSSESWGITITKSDSSGKKNLAGAEFELWQVDLNASTKGNIVSSKVGETATSEASGKVTFGTEDAKLASNTLYYFKEVKAPAGYEISFTGDTYVMLKSDATKTDYQAAYDKAVALGCIPSNAVSYSAYDELSKGSFDLGIEKKVEGADAPADAQFTFKAEATGDNAASAPKLSDVTVTSMAKGAGTYTGTFTGTLSDSMLGQTFTYNVSETAGTAGGWIYDSGTYTATVQVVEEGGKLVGNVSYAKNGTAADAMTFTNTYTAPATGEFQLKAKKTVNDAAPKAGETFEFSAKYESGYEGAKKIDGLIENAKTDASGMATFGTVILGEEFYGQSFVLRIHEEGMLSKEWTKAVDVFATVSVSQPTGTEKPTVTVKYNNEETQYASFNNTYSTSTSATLSLSKAVTGGTDAVKDKEFTFALYKKGSDEPLQTVVAKAGQTVSFANALEFTQAGTYEYDIKELGTNGDGWTYAESTTATVKVTENDDRSLSAEVSYGRAVLDSSAALFTNAYQASGDVPLSVYKTVNGGTDVMKDEEFSFDLYKSNADGEKLDKLANVTAKTGQKASFESRQIAAEGTYYYLIGEVGHNDNGWKADSDVLAKVVAADKDGKGTLSFDITYSSVDGAKLRATADGSSAAFDNTYATNVQLKLKKTANGGVLLKGESFGFTLSSVDAGKDTEVATATVDASAADGTVSLANLTFSAPGTYNYRLSEDANTAEGWTNADDIEFSFTVAYSSDGHSLVATLNDSTGRITQGDDGAYTATFNNSYYSETTATLKAHKTIEGATDVAAGKEFKFELRDQSGQLIDTETAKGGQTVSFDELSYSKLMCGTYTYTISESAADGSTAGWAFQDAVTATVVVGMDSTNRQVEVKSITYSMLGNTEYAPYVEADGTQAALFTNKYASAGSADISVQKTVNGGTEAAEGESFTFELYQAKKDEATGEWVKDGEAIDFASVKAGDTATFPDKDGKLHYTAADDGKTFTYIVHETGHNEGGWFAASDVLATVKVSDNGDGTIKAEVTYSNGTNAAAFDNVKSTVTGKIELYKTVNGGPAKPEESFTFQLQPQDGAPAAEQTDITVNGGGKADFGNIEFTEPGEYRYLIHETSELGDGWTNDADVEVVVKVVRDEDGKALKIESIDYGSRAYEADGEVMAHFDNKYVAPETPKEEGTQPKATETASTSVQATSTTKTGDNLMLFGGAALALAAVAAGIAAMASRRRKN